MPNLQFRDLTIIVPNEYWNKDDIDKLKRVANELYKELDELNVRANRNVFDNVCYNSVKIRDYYHLMIFISPNNKNNPYLCTYNAITKEYSKTISYKDFMKFDINTMLFKFQDRCRGIDKNTAQLHEFPDIKDKLQELADDYDGYDWDDD